MLGNGLAAANHHEDALSVKEAELSMLRRLRGSAHNILTVQNNLAITYRVLGRVHEALSLRQEVYSGRLKLNGEEHDTTLAAASNCANSLVALQRFEEARSMMRKTIPVARRVLGESDQFTLLLRWNYALSLNGPDGATLADHREAVETLESVANSWTRVLGHLHPQTPKVHVALATAREKLARAAGVAPRPSQKPR